MKKRIAVLILVFLLMLLAGCESAAPPASEPTPAFAESTEPPSDDVVPTSEPEPKRIERFGIDVSKWQGTIRWDEIASSGEVDFAIVRLGTNSGGISEDPKGLTNLRAAAGAGISAGVYFYANPSSAESSRKDADWVISKIEGEPVSFVVAYDIEVGSGGSKMTASERTDCAVAFLDRVREAGFEPALYVPQDEIEDPALWEADRLIGSYRIWVANYDASPDLDPFPNQNTDYDLWQYSNTGSVRGISGDCDLSVAYF